MKIRSSTVNNMEDPLYQTITSLKSHTPDDDSHDGVKKSSTQVVASDDETGPALPPRGGATSRSVLLTDIKLPSLFLK